MQRHDDGRRPARCKQHMCRMVEGRDVVARVGVPESLRGTSAYVGGAVTGGKAPARAAMCAGDDGGAPCEVAEKDGRLLSGSRFERHVRRSHNEVAPWNEIHDDGRIATGLAAVSYTHLTLPTSDLV